MEWQMCIYGVYFGNFNIESLVRLLDCEINSAYCNLALADNVGYLVYGIVEYIAERFREVRDKPFSAAVFGIFNSIRGRVLGHVGQECRTCAVISDEHSLDFHVAKILRKLGNVVEKARRFDNDCFSILFNNETPRCR